MMHLLPMRAPSGPLPEMNQKAIIIRPPSEANAIILQLTDGCSHNKCTFCGAYKNVSFSIRSDEQIERDLDFAARYLPERNRVFLGAGDALILPQQKLEAIISRIRTRLPRVNRISLYASGKAIRSKSDDQLQTLKKLGLDRVYLGIESGDDLVLQKIRKGENRASLSEAGRRVVAADLFLSATVLLGIAGIERSRVHARATAGLLNEIGPSQIAALCLMPLDNTGLGRDVADGRFHLLTAEQTALELRELVAAIELDRVQFMANHASNHLPLSGRLKKDKPRFLEQIDRALVDATSFVPEHLRAL